MKCLNLKVVDHYKMLSLGFHSWSSVYNFGNESSQYNLKNKRYILRHLVRKFIFNICKSFYILSTGKRWLHKCEICRSTDFELAVMWGSQKLAAGASRIIVRSAVKGLKQSLNFLYLQIPSMKQYLTFIVCIPKEILNW